MYIVEIGSRINPDYREEFWSLDEARSAIAQHFGCDLADDMRGGCPDEDDLIGIECWMPYFDADNIPDGTAFIYRRGPDLGAANVQDAIEMLRQGGVDLSGELSNINAAHADIEDELHQQGYSEIGFDADDLAAAIRDARAEG